MALPLERLGTRVACVAAATSIGIVTNEGRAVLVDSGLDDNLARKVSNHLASEGLDLEAVVVTHAHADHYGGNAFLAKRHPGLRIVAPGVEDAYVRNPILEPVSLYGGAPPAAFQGKFLKAHASPVTDVIGSGENLPLAGLTFRFHGLPGHSANQQAVEVDGVLFLSDALLPAESLEKHGLPYAYDAFEARESCRRILAIAHDVAHTYHGGRVHDLDALVDANVRAWDRFETALLDALDETPRTVGTICERVAKNIPVRSTPEARLLALSTLRGALAHLVEAGRADLDTEGIEPRFLQP